MTRPQTVPSAPPTDGAAPADDPVFIIGAPRSGTTWLAKIFDSHPDVSYCHEPDAAVRPPVHIDAASVVHLVRQWSADRSLRSAGKRPFFRKSWRSPLAGLLREGAAYGLMAAMRTRLGRAALDGVPLPDLADRRRARTVIKTVDWCDGIGVLARTLPASRLILILRSPFGQVHSMMRGARQGKFELRVSGDMPLDQMRAMACAEQHGVDAAGFEALSPAAQYAWGWVAFNEVAVRQVFGQSNVMLLRYEDLCARPEAAAREVLGFAGLAWHRQTSDFIDACTRFHGSAGYYDVMQNPVVAANRWREAMSDADRAEVARVAVVSSLARFYPELL